MINNFFYMMQKAIRFFLIVLGLCPSFFYTMELKKSPVIKAPFIKEGKQVPLYNFKEELASRSTNLDRLFPTKLLIVPKIVSTKTSSDTEILIGRHGAAYSLMLEKLTEKPICIAQLPNVKHAPMLAAAVKKAELLIAMAGNYTNDMQKRMAEVLLYNKKTKCFVQKSFDKPIQSIAMDNGGNWLVVAQRNSVQVIDLNDTDHILQTVYVAKNKDRISDADVVSAGNLFAFAGANEGVIRIHELKDNLPFLYTHHLTSKIKLLRFFDTGRILYAMNNGKVGHMDVTGEVLCKIPAQKFAMADIGYLEEIAFDSGDQSTIAYWTTKDNKNKGNQSLIKVRRIIGDTVQKFILEGDSLELEYEFESGKGRLEFASGYFIDVAVRGDCVVAIGTDGKLRVWKLPANEKNINAISVRELDGLLQKLEENQFVSRKRSFSNDSKSTKEVPGKSKIVPDNMKSSSSITTPHLEVNFSDTLKRANSDQRPSDTKLSPRKYQSAGQITPITPKVIGSAKSPRDPAEFKKNIIQEGIDTLVQERKNEGTKKDDASKK